MKSMVNRIGLAVLLVLAVSGAGQVLSAPPEGSGDRMARKMRVLERIIDEVMEQSPNILASGGSTNSLLLDGYGALFIVDGSLSGGGPYVLASGVFNKGLAAFSRAQSDFPASPALPHQLGDDTEDLRVPDSEGDLAESWETSREDERKKALEHLAGLKVELTETLLDYGATLGELAADDRVVVAVFLGGFGFDKKGPESLVLEVQMSVLRQFAAGQLSLEQARTKVVIKEK